MAAEAAKSSGPLALKFHQQPPEFPFQHVYFDVKIFCVELETGEPKCGSDMPIDLTLWYDETPRAEAPKDCIEVEGGSRELYIRRETGCCEVRVRTTKCSMDLANRSFALCASATGSAAPVVEAFSTPFKVMRHRLVIDDGRPWEETWYKDEGGREKCIELSVKLVDFENRLVTDRRVPLRVTLLYADSQIPVTNQDILKVFGGGGEQHGSGSGSSQGEVAIEAGVADVRLRIEDVSKNHQGQNFRVKVAPDTLNSPTDCDVSHDLSRSVTVRSKRNKRRAAQQAVHPAQQAVAAHPAPQQAAARDSSHSISRSLQSASDLRRLTADGPDDRCRLALHAAMDWINQALDGFAQMEWRRIGYEPLPDGAADTSRPLYVMNNPNERIAALVASFETNVAPCADAFAADDSLDPVAKRPRRAAMGPPLKSTRLASRPKFANGGRHLDDDESDDDDDVVAGDALPTTSAALDRPVLSRARTSVGAVIEAINGTKQGAAAGPPRFQASSVFDDADKTAGSLPPPTSTTTTTTRTKDAALAPPSMVRGVSSLFVGEGLPPQAAAATAGAPTADAAAPVEGGSLDLAEQAVRVVLAKRFKPPHSGAPLGFPAFDAEHRLVGLYREIQAGNVTQIVFVPADDAEAGLTRADCDLATKAYEREVANRSDCVHDLARFGSLDRLKENVAIYSWSKEAFANDLANDAAAAAEPKSVTAAPAATAAAAAA